MNWNSCPLTLEFGLRELVSCEIGDVLVSEDGRTVATNISEHESVVVKKEATAAEREEATRVLTSLGLKKRPREDGSEDWGR